MPSQGHCSKQATLTSTALTVIVLMCYAATTIRTFELGLPSSASLHFWVLECHLSCKEQLPQAA